MKNKLLLVVALLGMCLLDVSAQIAKVDLSTPLRQNQRMQLGDLLQFQVYSEAPESIEVYVQLTIEKQGNGIVGVLKTEYFQLSPGLTLSPVITGFNGSKLQMVSTRIGYESIQRPDFLFPDGRYNYCVELRDREGVLIHKDCGGFEEVNPQAFYLVYPFDQQELEEDRPVFTWTPLITSDGRAVDYRIRWIEQEERVNPREVFFNTSDFYQVQRVDENLLPYKIEYPEFDPKKYYYWQVEAYTGRTLLARSDIWEFHFAATTPPPMPTGPFVKVDLERFSQLHSFSGTYLSFEWANDYNDAPFEYKILDNENDVVTDHIQMDLGQADNGKNFFHLDISSLVQLDKVYTLVISGQKRDYKIKFKRVTP